MSNCSQTRFPQCQILNRAWRQIGLKLMLIHYHSDKCLIAVKQDYHYVKFWRLTPDESKIDVDSMSTREGANFVSNWPQQMPN